MGFDFGGEESSALKASNTRASGPFGSPKGSLTSYLGFTVVRFGGSGPTMAPVDGPLSLRRFLIHWS